MKLNRCMNCGAPLSENAFERGGKCEYCGIYLSPNLSEEDVLKKKINSISTERPFCWELKLFLAGMQLGRLQAQKAALSYQTQIWQQPQQSMDKLQFLDWLEDHHFPRLLRDVDSIKGIFAKDLMTAMGPPGKSGNHKLLISVGENSSAVYRDIWEWGMEFDRMLLAPELKNLQLLLQKINLPLIEDIDRFWQPLVEQYSEVQSGENICLNLNLNLRELDLTAIKKEMQYLAAV